VGNHRARVVVAAEINFAVALSAPKRFLKRQLSGDFLDSRNSAFKSVPLARYLDAVNS
jgi:hypothetical protein